MSTKKAVLDRREFEDAVLPDWDWGLRTGERAIKYFKLHKDDDVLAAVEIEVESSSLNRFSVGTTLGNIPECVWKTEHEGSLRNEGFEIVFKKPLPFTNAVRALSQAYPILDDARSTFRAAVHTHFNVQNFTREQYVRLCIAYALAEPYIYRVVGNGRDESVFCVPWYKSSGSVRALLHAYSTCNSRAWTEAIRTFPKYSGMNLNATRKYGSVEFRHLQTPAGGAITAIASIADYMYIGKWLIELALTNPEHNLYEFTDMVIDAIENRGYDTPSPKHLAFVYSLLVAYKPIDTLSYGFNIATARQVYTMVSPSWATRARRRVVPSPVGEIASGPPRAMRGVGAWYEQVLPSNNAMLQSAVEIDTGIGE